jgi:hypothetical protein
VRRALGLRAVSLSEESLFVELTGGLGPHTTSTDYHSCVWRYGLMGRKGQGSPKPGAQLLWQCSPPSPTTDSCGIKDNFYHWVFLASDSGCGYDAPQCDYLEM